MVLRGNELIIESIQYEKNESSTTEEASLVVLSLADVLMDWECQRNVEYPVCFQMGAELSTERSEIHYKIYPTFFCLFSRPSFATFD